MKQYMLDTNMVSQVLKSHPQVLKKMTAKPLTSICISAITEGELEYGLSKRPKAKTLHEAVRQFLLAVEVLPWGSSVAKEYGQLRMKMQEAGKSLSALDLLIAAHALDSRSILVTNDRAFQHVPGLRYEDWTLYSLE